MPSEDPRQTSLDWGVYRVVPLGAPIPHKIESLTSCGTLVFVGTSDSRLMVHRIGGTNVPHTGVVSLTLLHEHVDHRHRPIRSLTVVGVNRLLALIGDNIVVYRIHDDAAEPNSFGLREVAAVTDLKDAESFHVKRHKGGLTLAVLQRKRVTLYESSTDQWEFLPQATVPLPDGMRTLGWLGRSLILGGRKEYFLHHVSSASTVALYGTPRSGAAPLVLSMAPVPEALVASDGGGRRSLLSDGSEAPGDARVLWSTPPTAMSYDHPFAISYHPSSPSQPLQVRLPLLTTLEDTTAYPRHCLCQHLDIPRLAKMSQCLWTDYDCAMPTKDTPPDTLAQHPPVVSDADHQLYLLARNCIGDVAEMLATRQLFAAADLLCRLCPHQVSSATMRRIVTAGALHKFERNCDYVGCFRDFATVELDARVAIELFPEFAETHNTPLACVEVPLPRVSTPTPEAVAALVDYLQAQRATLIMGGGGSSQDVKGAQLAAIDYALVVALCKLNRDESLAAFVSGDTFCALTSAAAVLREHLQWVPLALLFERHKLFEEAAQTLRAVVCGDVIVTALPEQPALQALSEFFTSHAFSFADSSRYVVPSTLLSWMRSPSPPPFTSPLLRDGDAAAADILAGAVTALLFFRRLPVERYHRLLGQHASWLFAVVPAESAVTIFFSDENVIHHEIVVELLQRCEPLPPAPPRLFLFMEYLSKLLMDHRVHTVAPALYERYWRGLSELLFVEPGCNGVEVVTRQRYRERLDELLLASPAVINLEAAEAFFNDKDIRARCLPERAAVYRRQGKHRAAVEMWWSEAGSLDDAVAYAKGVSAESSGGAFAALLSLLLQPSENSEPHVEEALRVLNSCDGIDAATVLPMLPHDLPFARVSAFLIQAFRDTTTAHHSAAIYGSILAARTLRGEANHLRLSARSVMVDERSTCPVCTRKLRPETVLSIYPDGSIVHQGCSSDAHVCPATSRDFRHDAHATFEEL